MEAWEMALRERELVELLRLRWWTRAQRTAVQAIQRRSGLPVRKFCRRVGIAVGWFLRAVQWANWRCHGCERERAVRCRRDERIGGTRQLFRRRGRSACGVMRFSDGLT